VNEHYLCFLAVIMTFNPPRTPANIQDYFKEKNKAYPGQKRPGTSPEIFAPEIISTRDNELNIIITGYGDEIYFCRSRRNSPATIMVLKLMKGALSGPDTVSFSGTYSDMDPAMSINGKKILFGSNRPNGREGARGCDIWVAQ